MLKGMTKPFFCKGKSVLVIHDLQHINKPENFSAVNLFFLKTIIFMSARTSDVIITISEHVKNDVVSHYGIPEKKVHTVYNGLDNKLFYPRNKDEILEIRKKYNLPEKYRGITINNYAEVFQKDPKAAKRYMFSFINKISCSLDKNFMRAGDLLIIAGRNNDICTAIYIGAGNILTCDVRAGVIVAPKNRLGNI